MSNSSPNCYPFLTLSHDAPILFFSSSLKLFFLLTSPILDISIPALPFANFEQNLLILIFPYLSTTIILLFNSASSKHFSLLAYFMSPSPTFIISMLRCVICRIEAIEIFFTNLSMWLSY